jgi:hypothetical protein
METARRGRYIARIDHATRPGGATGGERYIARIDHDDLAKPTRAGTPMRFSVMAPTPAALAPIGVLLNGVSHSGSRDYCVFRAIAFEQPPSALFLAVRQGLHWLGQNL